MASTNKKLAAIAAVGVAATAIGFGISSSAQADQATPTPTTTATSGTAPGDGMGRGWGAGGRHGMGAGADLSELATKLGVSEDKLRSAMDAVRKDLSGEMKDLRDSAKGTNGSATDRQALRDQMEKSMADALAKELGIDASKVQAALDDLQAARQADRQEALQSRLDQAVKDGKLTQAEADAVKKAVDAGVLPFGGMERGMRGGMGRGMGGGMGMGHGMR